MRPYETTCPDCGKTRVIGRKTIKKEGNRCMSCSMKGKKNRGPGATLLVGYEHKVGKRILVRIKEGNGPGCWKSKHLM